MDSPLPPVRTWAGYRRVFRRSRCWKPAVRAVCGRHGIRVRGMETTFPGTCVAFLVNGNRLVKIFPPMVASDCGVEASALAAARRTGARVPRVVARGALRGGTGAAWPYLVLEPVPGRPVREVAHRIPRRDLPGIAAAAGRMLGRVHRASVRGLPRRAALRPRTLVSSALAYYRRAGVFPPALIRDMARRLPGLTRAAGRPRLVHGDLNDDHVIVARRGGRWRVTGIIDFGDATVGDPAYEWFPVWFDLLDRDPGLLRAFLRGGYPRVHADTTWRDRAAAFVLVHRFASRSVVAALGRDRPRDWPALRDRLWPRLPGRLSW